MRIETFTTGDFVAHRINHLCDSKISAWFKPDGTLLDCERIDRLNRSYPIPQNSPLRVDLSKIGQAHARHKRGPSQ